MTYRKPTTRFASDEEADDLLADILDSTESDARAEEERLSKTLAEQRAAAERRENEANAARIAQRQAKLEQEMQRQAKIAQKRTQKMAALQLQDEPPEESVTAEDAEQIEDEIRERIEAEVREQLRVVGMTPMPEPVEAPLPRTSNRAGVIALAAGLILAVGAAGIAFVMKGTYQTDPNTYAKAVYSPADRDLQSLEIGSTLIPKPDAVVKSAEPPKRSARNTPKAKRPTPKEVKPKTSFAKPNQNDANKSFNKLQEALSGSDPFSIDAQ